MTDTVRRLEALPMQTRLMPLGDIDVDNRTVLLTWTFGGTVVANANASAAGNAVNGFSALFQSTGLFNGAVVSGNNVGFACGNGSFMDAGGTSGASTTTAYSAFGAGTISRGGGTATAPTQYSPALNTAGNNNSYIF